MPTKAEVTAKEAERQAEANEAAAAAAENQQDTDRNTRDAFDVPTTPQTEVKDITEQRRDKVAEEWELLASTILQRWDLIPAAHWDRRRGNYEEVVDALVEFYHHDREEAERQVDYWLSQQYRAE